jgi:hypothetical protein
LLTQKKEGPQAPLYINNTGNYLLFYNTELIRLFVLIRQPKNIGARSKFRNSAEFIVNSNPVSPKFKERAIISSFTFPLGSSIVARTNVENVRLTKKGEPKPSLLNKNNVT